MTDKAPYPWAGYDWGTLYRSLAHPGNRYRYALLIPGPPQAKPREVAHHRTRGTRLFRVPEGWLILSAHPEVRGLQLKDLSQHPIRIGQGSRRSRIHSFRAFLYASRLLEASTIRSPLGPW